MSVRCETENDFEMLKYYNVLKNKSKFNNAKSVTIFLKRFSGNVVSIGTFSKIAAPGLRIGWYEMPKRVKDLLLETYVLFSGLGKSAYLSFVMAEVIKSGNMDSHVHLLKKKHKVRFSVY